ncbi:hypothetical protein Tcan_01006, partial [Toxocara canis]
WSSGRLFGVVGCDCACEQPVLWICVGFVSITCTISVKCAAGCNVNCASLKVVSTPLEQKQKFGRDDFDENVFCYDNLRGEYGRKFGFPRGIHFDKIEEVPQFIEPKTRTITLMLVGRHVQRYEHGEQVHETFHRCVKHRYIGANLERLSQPNLPYLLGSCKWKQFSQAYYSVV